MAKNRDKPKVYEVDLDEVKQLPNNPNDGTQRGDYMLEESMQQGGVGRGILLADDGTILAGNHSTQKYAELFEQGKIVVVETDGDTLVATKRRDIPNADDPRAKKLIIADNRANEVGLSWSPEELQRIADDPDIDLGKWFYDEELDEIMAEFDTDEPPEDPGAQIDRASELQEVWQTERGQVWVIESKTVPGKSHRVMCGDSTDAGDVALLMGDSVPVGLITDPPYSSGGFTRSDRTLSTDKKYVQSGTKKVRPDFSGDNRDQRSWISWCERWLAFYLKVCQPEAVVCVWTDWRQLPALTDAVQGAGWVWRGVSVWNKTEAARPLYGRFRPQSEFLVWGSSGSLPLNNGQPAFPGVITQSVDSDKMHQTQKPANVVAWSMSMVGSNSVVVDPFLGSGTTLVACEQTGRVGYGMEISPAYVAVCLQRLTDLGLAAVRADG